jgi:hypothetical protein
MGGGPNCMGESEEGQKRRAWEAQREKERTEEWRKIAPIVGPIVIFLCIAIPIMVISIVIYEQYFEVKQDKVAEVDSGVNDR